MRRPLPEAVLESLADTAGFKGREHVQGVVQPDDTNLYHPRLRALAIAMYTAAA